MYYIQIYPTTTQSKIYAPPGGGSEIHKNKAWNKRGTPKYEARRKVYIFPSLPLSPYPSLVVLVGWMILHHPRSMNDGKAEY